MRHELYHVLAPMGLETKLEDAQELVSDYDPSLVVAWIPNHDRWGIYTADRRGACYLVHEVKDEQGGYRDLSGIDIEAIAERDNAKGREAHRRLLRIESDNAELKSKQQTDRLELIGEIMKDHWRSTFNIPYITSGIEFKKVK